MNSPSHKPAAVLPSMGVRLALFFLPLLMALPMVTLPGLPGNWPIMRVAGFFLFLGGLTLTLFSASFVRQALGGLFSNRAPAQNQAAALAFLRGMAPPLFVTGSFLSLSCLELALQLVNGQANLRQLLVTPQLPALTGLGYLLFTLLFLGPVAQVSGGHPSKGQRRAAMVMMAAGAVVFMGAMIGLELHGPSIMFLLAVGLGLLAWRLTGGKTDKQTVDGGHILAVVVGLHLLLATVGVVASFYTETMLGQTMAWMMVPQWALAPIWLAAAGARRLWPAEEGRGWIQGKLIGWDWLVVGLASGPAIWLVMSLVVLKLMAR